jgi:enoyl-CoA hydratase
MKSFSSSAPMSNRAACQLADRPGYTSKSSNKLHKPMLPSTHEAFFSLHLVAGVRVLRLQSSDGMNRLTRARVAALRDAVDEITTHPAPLIVTGNQKFFSVGADLQEIAALTSPAAYEFSWLGQRLMDAVERAPAPVCAAVSGYCMGGGLDLALACHHRIASPNAIFGHRGAALGLITGWGGTQRLSRLIGKSPALHMFAAAEKIDAQNALKSGLVDQLADNPVRAALRFAQGRQQADAPWKN